jgi:hypothetical protein
MPLSQKQSLFNRQEWFLLSDTQSGGARTLAVGVLARHIAWAMSIQ